MHPTTGNDASTVFADKDTAMMTCEATPGCGGIATQSNVCGGKYRINIVEGTEDWKYWPDWELPAWQLWAYDLDRSCCAGCRHSTSEPTAKPVLTPEPTTSTVSPCWEYKQGYYERTTHFMSFNGQLDCFGLS